MRTALPRWKWLALPVPVIALLCIYVASHASGQTAGKECHLSILHTNDLHSHDESFVERGRVQGGITRIGHMIRTLKKSEPDALVIDAGDIFQGTPIYTEYHGAVEVALLNDIGYDIFTIGNHEFDDGPKNLAEQLKKAKFSVINCNMDCSKVPELEAVIKPYVIKEVDGQKVAFIGAITPELNSVALRTGGVTLKAPRTDWMRPIRDQIAVVKEKGINKIVLVTHVGVELDKELAALPDVDLIISGHSHTRLDTALVVEHPDGSSTTVVQTGCFARNLGKLEITFDDKGRVIVPKTQYRLINMSEKVPEESDLKAFVDEKEKPLLSLRTTIAGVAKKAFDNSFRTTPWDSSLGDVICDALVESGKNYGAQLSFENRGGIRGRIEPGPISLEEVQSILPFDNRAVFATVNGACVMNILEHSLTGGLGGLFLDEHGLKIAYDKEKPAGKRVIFALAKGADGTWKPIKSDAKYKIAINDYSFGGGEGYDFKSATNVVKDKERLSDVFKEYLDTHHTIAPERPLRIVPVTDNLLALAKIDDKMTVQIRGATPLSHITFVSGDTRGISCLENGIPVPVANGRVIGKAQCDDSGSCDWHLPSTNTGAYITAVTTPMKSSDGKKLISYPVKVN